MIFASGAGSNAETIIRYFQKDTSKRVVAVFSNKAEAPVVGKAMTLGISTVVFTQDEWAGTRVLERLKTFRPDLIVLAGFLWKFPQHILREFPQKTINIHPSLLPKYGGEGMYGKHVHQAVFDHQESETGITIHYVNERYDEGEFIFQKAVSIQDCPSPEAIAQKVHELEQRYFPQVISTLLTNH